MKVFFKATIMDKKAQLGEMLKKAHDLWDLEAFSREVKRRKVLEQMYHKLYKFKEVEGIEIVLNPRDIADYIYSRAADAHPYR